MYPSITTPGVNIVQTAAGLLVQSGLGIPQTHMIGNSLVGVVAPLHASIFDTHAAATCPPNNMYMTPFAPRHAAPPLVVGFVPKGGVVQQGLLLAENWDTASGTVSRPVADKSNGHRRESPKLPGEGEEEKNVRKRNDRDKKRRKRNRIGDLIKQLDNRLPKSVRQRSVNEILTEICKMVKDCKEAPVLEDKSTQRNKSSSPAQLKTEEGTVPNGVGSDVSMEVDSEMLRFGLFAQSDCGVAIVTDQLQILDCNPVFVAAILGEPLPDNSAAMASPKLTPSQVTGLSLSNFIRNKVEQEHIMLALKHVITAVYKSENSRRFTLGVNFPMGPNGEDRFMPVDIVPSGTHSEQLYIMHVHIVDTAPCSVSRVAKIFSSCGRTWTTVGSALHMEVMDELDGNGAHKSAVIHQHLDPLLSMIRVLRMILVSGTLEDFNTLIQSKGSSLGDMWEGVKRALNLEKLAETLKNVSTDQCMDVIFMQLPSNHYQLQMTQRVGQLVMRISLQGIVLWEWTLQQNEEFGNNSMEGKVSHTRKGQCKEINERGSSTFRILKNGSIWFFYREPIILPVPASVCPSGTVKLSFNCVVEPHAGQGFIMRKFYVSNTEMLSQTRAYSMVDESLPVCGDFQLFCHLLGVMETFSNSRIISSGFLNHQSRVLPTPQSFGGSTSTDSTTNCDLSSEAGSMTASVQDFLSQMRGNNSSGASTPNSGGSFSSIRDFFVSRNQSDLGGSDLFASGLLSSPARTRFGTPEYDFLRASSRTSSPGLVREGNRESHGEGSFTPKITSAFPSNDPFGVSTAHYCTNHLILPPIFSVTQ